MDKNGHHAFRNLRRFILSQAPIKPAPRSRSKQHRTPLPGNSDSSTRPQSTERAAHPCAPLPTSAPPTKATRVWKHRSDRERQVLQSRDANSMQQTSGAGTCLAPSFPLWYPRRARFPSKLPINRAVAQPLQGLRGRKPTQSQRTSPPACSCPLPLYLFLVQQILSLHDRILDSTTSHPSTH